MLKETIKMVTYKFVFFIDQTIKKKKFNSFLSNKLCYSRYAKLNYFIFLSSLKIILLQWWGGQLQLKYNK